MRPSFRTGAAEARRARNGGSFEAALLPDDEKERLCRNLLSEFGVTHIRTGGNGELIHGCILPWGNHKDQDRSPTASLNFKKLTYRCLGSCNAGGGFLWFIATVRGDSSSNARKWLSEQTGTGAEDQSLSSLLSYFDAVYSTRKVEEEPLPHMDTRILEQWQVIHPYLTEHRGIPEDNIIQMRVGYGKLGIRVDAHTVVESHRIIIPHFWRGELVGWQSRRLTDDGTAKYMSSPSLPKDRTLYNYNESRREVVVVESPMSVLSKAHLPHHMEATFGASVTERQMRLVARHPKVILFMDNDAAGWGATWDLGDFLGAYSSVWVADNPYAADPADMDDETYLRAIEGAVPYAIWQQPKELVKWNGDR